MWGETIPKWTLLKLKVVQVTGNMHSEKGLVDPANGLLINTLYDVFKQHIPFAGIVRITMW